MKTYYRIKYHIFRPGLVAIRFINVSGSKGREGREKETTGQGI